jgi:DNA-binding transcriptional LysR family regulator
MNLNFLSTFIEVVRTNSFSIAAKNLGKPQPVVSRQIKEMENELKNDLFLRNKKQIQMTEFGQKFYASISQTHSALLEELNSFSKTKNAETHLNLASTFEAGEKILFPTLKKLRQEFPRCYWHLNLTSSQNAVQLLESGQVDAILVTTKLKSKAYNVVELALDQAVLVSSLANEAQFKKLEKIPMVGYRKSDLYSLDFLKRVMPKVYRGKTEFVASVNSHQRMLDLVKTGDVFAVLPLSSAWDDINDNKIKMLAKDSKKKPLYLISLSSLERSKKEILVWIGQHKMLPSKI